VKIDRATLGPVEVMAVAFHGDQFRGKIIPALHQLVDKKIIRVLDLAFVRKTADGTVSMYKAGEIEGTEVASFAELAEVDGLLVRDADLAAAGQALEPGNAAAVLVWEDLWAKRLVDAIGAANGQLLSLERVPRYAVDELLDTLEAG
jgi:hypothetical protein